MRRPAALLILTAAATGCGGSAKPKPITGCQGLPTASKSISFLVLFGSTNQVTQRFVCANFGAPQKVTRRGAGLADWTYGKAIVTFKGRHAVSYTTYDSNGGHLITVGHPLNRALVPATAPLNAR